MVTIMTLLQHYQLSLLLTAASSVLVGLWVLIQKRSSQVAQLFCLYSLGVGFWGWCQAQAGSSPTPTTSLLWGRAMFYAVIGFPVLLTNFFATFLGIAKRKPSLVGWMLVAAFLPFLSSDLFLYESGPIGFLPSFPRAGPLFLPFNLIWLGWFLK